MGYDLNFFNTAWVKIRVFLCNDYLVCCILVFFKFNLFKMTLFEQTFYLILEHNENSRMNSKCSFYLKSRMKLKCSNEAWTVRSTCNWCTASNSYLFHRNSWRKTIVSILIIILTWWLSMFAITIVSSVAVTHREWGNVGYKFVSKVICVVPTSGFNKKKRFFAFLDVLEYRCFSN